MSFFGKPIAVAASAVALSGAALAPLGFALAAGAAPAFAAPAPVQVASAPAPLPLPTVSRPQAEALVVEQPADPEDADAQDADESAPATQVADSELTCLAKVIVHEAGNQPREGQMAVAQVVMNRLNDSRHRFGRTICGVVMQRGQFFNVNAYNPPRNARWFRAMEIAREAASGTAEPVMEGALFFHAAYAGNAFHGRTRVGRIAGHVFYR